MPTVVPATGVAVRLGFSRGRLPSSSPVAAERRAPFVRGLRPLVLLAAAIVLPHAALQAQTDAYDVFVVETRGRPLDQPTTAAMFVGRLVAPPTIGESERAAVRAEDGQLSAAVKLIRRTDGVHLSYSVNDRDEDDFQETKLDRPIAGDADAAFRRGRNRRPRQAGIVALRAEGETPSPKMTPVEILRRLCDALSAGEKPPESLGRILGRAPLKSELPEADAARFREAWGRKLKDGPRSKGGMSPYLPALLALADADAVAYVYSREPADDLPAEPDLDETEPTVEIRGTNVVTTRTTPGPLSVRLESSLAGAYAQATDPIVRGTAGWLSYKYNPGYFFAPLAAEVAAGRAILPGDDPTRARREKILADGLRMRDIGPPLLAVGIGLATMAALLVLMRLLLTRFLFR